MPPRSRRSAQQAEARVVTPERGAPLEPIRVVERELTRPDGTKVVVKVPVYPPFELRRTPAAPESGESRRRRRLGRRKSG